MPLQFGAEGGGLGGGGGLGEEAGAEGGGVFLQGFGGAGVLQAVEQDPELLIFAERILDKPQAVFTCAAGRFAARLRGGCRVRRELLQDGRRFRIGPGGRERGFGAGEEGRFAPLLLRRQDAAVFPHGQGRAPLPQQLLRAGERVRAGRDAARKAGRAEGNGGKEVREEELDSHEREHLRKESSEGR